jgi:hypothetical protein
VIAYASRSLTKPEQAYSTTEKECLAVVWGIEKMRPYLEGYRFTVFTDHQSLKWLRAIKDRTGRLARWAIFLQQHDFDIRYRKGVLNRVADTLSRQPAATEDETTPEDLFALKDAPGCNWYNRMRQEVEKDPTAHPDYCIRNERLHRHFWDMSDSTEPELSDPWKLCVPKPVRAAVLRECHDNPTAGHLGIAKTTARLALRYYWPGMFRPVRPELPILPTVQDAAAATAGENVPDTEPAAMGDRQHRPGGPSSPLQPRQLLRRRHAGPVHQVGAMPSRPKSYRPCGHPSALRGRHHPIRIPSDGDLGQWDPIHRRNISHSPPGTWDRTSADTAIHAPGEPRGKDEQNPEDHGGPVLRGRPEEVGRPSSGADVRPQHLTPRVDKVHASTAELWPRTRGTQCSPPSDTPKCRRRSARRHHRR